MQVDLQALNVFKSQYFQLVPVQDLKFPEQDVIRNIQAQKWLHDELFDTNGPTKYLPSTRYQVQVLKRLLILIEESVQDPDHDDISDELTNSFVELMSKPVLPESSSIQQRTHVTYTFFPHDKDTKLWTITLLESRNIISAAGTTGLRTWEASLHLGSFLASSQGSTYVSGKRILELGAGTGLISVLCAKYLQSKHVLATDGSPDVVDALSDNLFLNGLQSNTSISTRLFRWGGTPEDDEDGQKKIFNVVLGADITFDSISFPYLLSTLRMCFENNPDLVVLISAPVRNEKTFTNFQAACKSARLSIELLHFDVQEHGGGLGPFYFLKVPIDIMKIQPEPGVKFDSFAIR